METTHDHCDVLGRNLKSLIDDDDDQMAVVNKFGPSVTAKICE